MITTEFSETSRQNKTQPLTTDFVIAGGGLAGVCAAITAARAGSQVVLIQDRPVLGGNASSEVRLWALGATSHMGNNNRWSREGGVIDEIMLENMHVNRHGNALIFDALLLDKVIAEKNITLLLNTALYQVNKSTACKIDSVEAFCSQNSTHYHIEAPLFCDATGDGLMAFNAGASFRMGAESKEEFGELMAPDKASKDLLGHSLFFYSKRLDHPVSYTKPEFAYSHEDIAAIPRSKEIHGTDSGCKFWWLEFGGIMDTIYQSEDIKWELWKIVYGIWDYIKNSGKFEDVENLTLEWVGTVPGKRESRRFEGEYIMTQQDIVKQRPFDDAVSFGGWAIDLHPVEGVYSDKPACSQFHAKGVYQIPYRSFVSRDMENLFLAGRIISASHIAFGSTRVMITCAHGGQAVGEAAALCRNLQCEPKALLVNESMRLLQQRLSANGQGIPGVALCSSELTQAAMISASSTMSLHALAPNREFLVLDQSIAQLLPLNPNSELTSTLNLQASCDTELTVELRVSCKAENYTPDTCLQRLRLPISQGEQSITLPFTKTVATQQYAFICFMANSHIAIEESDQRITGLCTVMNKQHKAVSNNGSQQAPENSGLESFEFWTPERRPAGKNIALRFNKAIEIANTDFIRNGYFRPYRQSNAWIASFNDNQPTLTLKWPEKREIKTIKLYFDTDADHALETVLMEHPETTMPFCIRNYRLKLQDGTMLYEKQNNYQTINTIMLEKPVVTDNLILELDHPASTTPASLLGIELSKH